MAGITSQGLEIKRLTKVREDLRQQANSIFGDLVPNGDFLDTSSASTIGRMIGLISPSEADLWEAIQQVYSAFDPNSASGTQLDNLVALSGLVRNPAVSSTARVLLSGDYNVTIPSGSTVSSSFTNNKFEIPDTVVLDENNNVGIRIKIQNVVDSNVYTITYNDGVNSVDLNYTSDSSATESEILTGLRDSVNNNLGSILTATIDVDILDVVVDDQTTNISWSLSGDLFFFKATKPITVIALESGPKEQPSGTIDTISTPVFGWDSVTQIAAAIVGSNTETDSALRQRFNDAKFSRGSNLLESLYSDLISLPGVDNVRIAENDTNTTDSDGLPPNSFSALVVGGVDSDIAEAVWRNKPAGIQTFGNTTSQIEDVQGTDKNVNFERPSFVDVYVSVDITSFSDFPVNGVEDIKSALSNYFANNFGIGDDVVYSRLYTPINSVPGHEVDNLFIDTSASPSATSTISVSYNQIPKLEIGNIEVNVA